MNLLTGKNTSSFAKDTVCRFMKMLQINWIRFTTLLSGRIIKEAIIPLDSEERADVLIIDDSMFERNRSKRVELLKQARNADIPAKYVLFDSWFSSPGSLHSVKEIGYDVIGMVKKTSKMMRMKSSAFMGSGGT